MTVEGYFGEIGSTPFNVVVLPDAGGEPSDSADPVCATTGTGTPTGAAFPAFDTTVITLAAKCVAKKGVNWVIIQSTGPNIWFWRLQDAVGAENPGDFRENGAFGTGCTAFQNGRDMESCVFGGPQGNPDFQLALS